MSWLRFLDPDDERAEPLFREEIERLALAGLRIASLLMLVGSALWLVLGATVMPEVAQAAGLAAMIGVAGFALAGLWLSYQPWARGWARVLGLVLLAVMPAFDLLGSHSVPITEGERWAFFTSVAILIMLVTIALIPVRPLQTAGLALFFVGMYAVLLARTGADWYGEGPAGIGLMFLVMTAAMCTVLTAVVYRQRASAFRSKLTAEAAFRELRDAQVRVSVSENAASQSRFAAALSHELNTPLGSLTSAFDTLVHAHEQERAQPERRERLEAVWRDARRSGLASAERLRQILDRMKRLTNLDRAEEQVVDLNQLFSDTAALLSAEVEPKARLDLELTPLAPVRCRPQQMGAVFSNLLRNAAAAMDARGVIRIVTGQTNGEVRIEIRDDGRGMPEEQVRDLFNPSFRVEHGRVTTTNWGLFICRSIVSEHGGALTIDSAEGAGTTATIRLPAGVRTSPPELE